MSNKNKIILDLCGGTGSWSKPYRDAGYDVRLITLPDNDVRTYNPPENVYGILAAPPCTVFSLAGNWVKRSNEEMLEALSVVDACLRIIYKAKPKFWALENPVGKLKNWIGESIFRFDPWEFGDGTFKKTALWGNFNKPIQTVFEKPERIPYSQTPIGRLGGKSAKTKELRSITPQGFAKAFFKANQ